MQRFLPLALILIGTMPVAWGAEVKGLSDPTRIPNQYLVKLKAPNNLLAEDDDTYVLDQAVRIEATYGVKIFRQYTRALQGYAIKAKDAQIKALAEDDLIEWIEADKLVKASETQERATWGIDRIDARSGIDGVYKYTTSGRGVHAYIIDTGLRPTHSEFTGRVSGGFSSVEDSRGINDCNGHGTHVAGTVGGTIWGVAKSVKIHSIRVLDCEGSGTIEGVVAGIDWLMKNVEMPAVANMSLGGSKTQALDDAVKAAIDLGIHFAVAAGNEASDACESSPANVPDAITVGATNKSDQRAYFSNTGTCVDIFAPGDSITSSWLSGDKATSILSGTSMASPHVAGAIALLLETEPDLKPEEVAFRLRQAATIGKIKGPGEGSPNAFLFTGPTTFD